MSRRSPIYATVNETSSHVVQMIPSLSVVCKVGGIKHRAPEP